MTTEQIGQTTAEKEVAMGEEIKTWKKAVNELEATINAETTTEQEATFVEVLPRMPGNRVTMVLSICS